MTWYYKNEIFEPDETYLENWVGFVYIVTEKDTNMKYIGKKLFRRQVTLPITKTRKRKQKKQVESDWKTYCGSSQRIMELVEEKGLGAYHREILRLCKSKGECSYYESMLQFKYEVLLRDDFYNGIINCRINKKHLKGIERGDI